jgi:hypothetical protein
MKKWNESFRAEEPYLFGRLGQPSVVDILYRRKKNGFFIECTTINYQFKQ